MVPIKPHTLNVHPVKQDKLPGARRVGNPVKGTAVSVTGYLEPMTPSETFKSWGVELQSAFKFICEVSDAAILPVQALAERDGSWFSVIAEPETHNAGLITDHSVIYLQGIQYPQEV